MQKQLLFFTVFLLAIPVPSVRAQEEVTQDIDAEIGDALPQEITEEIAAPPTKCSFSDEEVVTIIAGALTKGDILRLLRQDLYKRTNPLHVRSLLDLPSLEPYYLDYYGWQTTGTVFYNQTTRAFFYDSSPFAKEYLFLEDSPLANEIDTILQDINELGLVEKPITISVPQALGLFKNLRLQERRLGLMLSVAKQYDNLSFSLRIPLFYQEHNFFLNTSEIEQIKNAPFLKLDSNNPQTPLPDPEAEEKATSFGMKNLANDRFGIGDTRFMALYNVYDNGYCNTWLGFLVTLPTAYTILNGLVLGCFDPHKPDELFSLQEVINFNNCGRMDAITQTVERFSIGALRRLSTLLVNVPLGNGHHWGAGPYFDMKHYLTNYMSMHTRAYAEFFNRRKHLRFFLTDKSQENFNRDLEDESLASENLAFINAQITNTFFPHALCIDVKPGSIFRLTHSFLFDSDRWHLGVGFDFWYQSSEHIATSGQLTQGITPATIARGRLAHAYEGKITSQAGYYAAQKDFSWHVVLVNDIGVFSHGVGKSFTLGLRIGVDI